LLRTLQLVCIVFLPLCCSSEDPHLACSPTAASPDDTLWALATEQLSLDLSIDRRGDNLGRWKEDTLGLNRAQIKFPGPTLAQVLQEWLYIMEQLCKESKSACNFYTFRLFELPCFLGVLE
jgi:hypothetical protein